MLDSGYWIQEWSLGMRRSGGEVKMRMRSGVSRVCERNCNSNFCCRKCNFYRILLWLTLAPICAHKLQSHAAVSFAAASFPSAHVSASAAATVSESLWHLLYRKDLFTPRYDFCFAVALQLYPPSFDSFL